MGTMSVSYSHVINLDVYASVPHNAWSKLCIRVVPLVRGLRACTVLLLVVVVGHYSVVIQLLYLEMSVVHQPMYYQLPQMLA